MTSSSGSSHGLAGEVEFSREARSTGSHPGGHATGCSASASLLATLVLVTYGMTPAQISKAAAPARTGVWKREACFLACVGYEFSGGCEMISLEHAGWAGRATTLWLALARTGWHAG